VVLDIAGLDWVVGEGLGGLSDGSGLKMGIPGREKG